jgi:hypothetical protein
MGDPGNRDGTWPWHELAAAGGAVEIDAVGRPADCCSLSNDDRLSLCRLWEGLGVGVNLVSPVFVGRRSELAVLVDALTRATADESGFILVGGEAGVGKSRFIGEVSAAAAAAGMRVLSGQCVPLGAEGLPFAPLVDALRDLARSTPSVELDEILGSARRQLARLLPDLDPHSASGSSESRSKATRSTRPTKPSPPPSPHPPKQPSAPPKQPAPSSTTTEPPCAEPPCDRGPSNAGPTVVV